MPDTPEDADAQIFLLTHVTEKFRINIQDKETAFDMWTKLKDLFTTNARSRLAVLRAQLPGLKQSKSEKTSDYVTRVRTFCSEVNKLGGSMDDLAIAQSIILGLSSDFAYVLLQLSNSMVQNPDLENLEDQSLMHEELLRKTTNIRKPDPAINLANPE